MPRRRGSGLLPRSLARRRQVLVRLSGLSARLRIRRGGSWTWRRIWRTKAEPGCDAAPSSSRVTAPGRPRPHAPPTVWTAIDRAGRPQGRGREDEDEGGSASGGFPCLFARTVRDAYAGRRSPTPGAAGPGVPSAGGQLGDEVADLGRAHPHLPRREREDPPRRERVRDGLLDARGCLRFAQRLH